MALPLSFLIFINLLTYFLIILLLWKAYKPCYQVRIKNRQWAIILIILFFLFAFWGGDYEHYLLNMKEIAKDYTSIEGPYVFFAKMVGSMFLPWRFIIWGGGFWLLLKLFKLVDVPRDLALVVFVTLYLHLYSYARVSLSMTIMFFGLALLYSSKRKRNIILAFAIILSSYFFHKTALFGVVAILIGLVATKNERKIVIAAVIFLPTIFVFIQDFLSSFLNLYAFDYSLINVNVGQKYLMKEAQELGTGTKLAALLEHTTMYLVAMLYVIMLLKNEIKEMPKSVRIFSNVSFYTIMVASLFALDLGANTAVIYARFIRYSMIPSAIFVAYVFSTRQHRKLVRVILITGFMSVTYYIIYTMYNAYVVSAGFDILRLFS